MGIKITVEIELGSEGDSELEEKALELLELALARRGRTPADNALKMTASPRFFGNDREVWSQFFEGLQSRSRQFAELIQERAPSAVSRPEAMSHLGMSDVRAFGGMVGSIQRWSAAQGVPLPWTVCTQNGVRAWRWRGFTDQGDIAPTPPEAAEARPALTYAEFMDNLPEQSRRFIQLVESEGRIDVETALAEMGKDDLRSLGGVIGSIKRWATASGVMVPFVGEVIEGRKTYRWVGNGEQ